jgi:3-deoxy-D-manno-octulosonate 8-phosphate phosphatase (KDO 8-P phosphatase)
MPESGTARLDTVRSRFRSIDGQFVTDVREIASRLEHCRAFVFDWDGVWNAGRKGSSMASGFAEADSMGLNMLRYGFWRQRGEIPFTAIISGENNRSAAEFAEREHLHDVYTRVTNKRRVIAHLCERERLEAENIVCMYDDINDLSMAIGAGIRVMARRDASLMLLDYTERRSLCDYRTGSSDYPVRETCELLLAMLGNFDEVVDSRVAYDADYQAYFAARQAIATKYFSVVDDAVIEVER